MGTGSTRSEQWAEEQFRLLVETSSDVITVLDPVGTILYQSPSLERVLGYRPEERIGRNAFESPLLHPDDVDAKRAFITEALHKPNVEVSAEFRLQHADGTYRWIAALGRNLLAEAGVRGIVANYRDITQWKHSQEELAERTRLANLGADLGTAITQPGDLQGMLQRCAEVLVRYLDPALIRIWTLDEGWQVLILQASAGTGTDINGDDSRVPVGRHEVGLVAQERRPLLINSLLDDPRSGDRKWMRRDGIVAFAGYPLVIEDRLVGVLALFARQPLTERVLVALGSVADTLALGIERKWAEEELRRSLNALLVLHEAGRVLGSSLKLDELGPKLLDITRHVAGVTAAVLSLRGDDGKLEVCYAAGLETLWRRARDTATAETARGQVLERGMPEGVRVDLSDTDPVCVAAWYLPLWRHSKGLGLLEVYGPRSLEDGEIVELLVSLASQAAGAIENAQLYGRLADRERKLQELVGQLITAQEEERRRVAYEVHDGVAQMAAAAHQHLQVYAHSHTPRSREARDRLDLILEIVRQTVSEARRVIADLRPTELDDLGLAQAIDAQLEVLRSKGWVADFEDLLGSERLPPEVETTLLRVTQEALRNARRHARTERVRVVLVRLSGAVRLEVRDWGRGFDPNAVQHGAGPGERVGLAGMRERVALLGGRLKVRSRLGAGTMVMAEIPILWEGAGNGSDEE